MTISDQAIAAPIGDDLLPWRDPEFVRTPWPWFARVREELPPACARRRDVRGVAI